MINLTELPQWQPPWSASGANSLIRISSSALKKVPGNCEVEKVAKAHIDIKQELKDWSTRKDTRAVFLLGAVQKILALPRTPANIDEFVRKELGVSATEPSIRAAKSMVSRALDAVEEFAAEDLAVDLVLTPTTDFVCVAASDTQRLELTSWGVYYQNEDKSFRELRLFCYKNADLTRDRNQLVAAVNILLNGAITDGSPAIWTEPYQTLPTNPPQRVRVRQIGCVDGSAATLFDGDAASAAAFVGGITSVVHEFLVNTHFVPGNSCVECRFRVSCPEIVKSPGFLGLPTSGKISKSLSKTMLNSYQRCNYQYFLASVLKLPKSEFESTQALVRGQAVHDWIMKAHERQIPCSIADLPESGLGEIASSLGWTQEYLDQARSWISSHFQVCPLQTPNTKLRCEESRTTWDSDADVVITTRADEVGVRNEKPLWREIKTTSTLQQLTEAEYLLLYPQVAFAIGIQADSGGTVELEILTPESGKVLSFDTTDPRIVLAARKAMAISFDAIHHDEEFLASPGMACINCPVSSWCDKRVESANSKEVIVEGLTVDVVTGEIINDQPVAIDALARALALVEPVDQTDDVPF